MKKMIPLSILPLLLAGCMTNEPPERVLMNEKQQAAFLAKPRHPRLFGLHITMQNDALGYVGACRLHPNHLIELPMEDDLFPVVEMSGRAGAKGLNTLLDSSSAASWAECKKAVTFGAVPLGIGDQRIPYRGNSNTGGVPAYAALISQLRIQHFFLEYIPLYVQMATGNIGPQARGVTDPTIHAVLGYDNLSSFSFIQLDYLQKKIRLSASKPYQPEEERLMASAAIIPLSGYGLAVEGAINGKKQPIIIDIAGNFSFAYANHRTTKRVEVGALLFSNVETLPIPSSNNPPARMGKELLKLYRVTICPRKGRVYFERPPMDEDESMEPIYEDDE